MLSKPKIIDKLEEMRRAELTKLKEEFNAKKREEFTRIEQEIGVPAFAELVHSKVMEIFDALNEFRDNIEKSNGKELEVAINRAYWGGIDKNLAPYSTYDSTYKGITTNDICIVSSPLLDSLNSQQRTAEGNLLQEWSKVIANCRGMKNNKACVNYLVSIGFEESLFNPEVSKETALMTPVDFNNLFHNKREED